MGIKKTIKKGKKAGKKAGKAADSAGKSVGKTVDNATDDATDWAGKAVNKGYNAATGAIEGTIDKVVNYSEHEFNAAVNYAEKTYNEGVDWLEDLAQEAIEAAYRAAYNSVVGDYIKLASEIMDVETKLFSKPSNILTSIRDNLFVGKFTDASADVQELLTLDIMKKTIDLGHELHGTSFIIAADLSFTGSYGALAGGATGFIGITQMLDHFQSTQHSTCVFSGAGPAVGLGASATGANKGNLEFGIILGFVSKDPTNIGGWFVDLSGGGGMSHGAYSVGLSWSPPGSKPPYVKPKPVAGSARIAITTEALPNGSVTLGGSYTFLIQKIKNDLYKG